MPGKSYFPNPCFWNWRHRSRSVVWLIFYGRWCPWTVLRSDKIVWVWRVPWRYQLSILGGLCWQGQTIHRMHLPAPRLQDQIPIELFPPQGQSRMFQHQSNLRVLWRMYNIILSPGKRKYNLKLWKTFSDVFNVLPVCALIDEKILCMHGGLSPQL